jgi:hypothetical protein
LRKQRRKSVFSKISKKGLTLNKQLDILRAEQSRAEQSRAEQSYFLETA